MTSLPPAFIPVDFVVEDMTDDAEMSLRDVPTGSGILVPWLSPGTALLDRSRVAHVSDVSDSLSRVPEDAGTAR